MAFHRLGRGVVILLMVKMMGVVVMGMPLPDSKDDLNDCRFKDEFEVPHPFKVQLLAYINRLPSVALGFKYLDVNFGRIRDGVNLTSTEAIHSRVRDYETTENPIRLPLNIPEGWNTFRLTVAEKTLTVTLVQGKDHVDLFVLPLNDTVSIMYVDGSVARCSEASPEWAVAKGEEVNVLLQPGFSDRDQWFKVSARDSADPYIKFPSAMSTRTLVPANTTLKVTTILRGDHVLLRVFKTGENSDEEVARGNATLTLPWKLVVGGGSHVRLTLFSAPATPADLPTRTYSIASIVPYLEGACGMLAVVVVVVLVLRLKKRLKRNKKNENKNIQLALLSEPLSALSQRQEFKVDNIMTYTEEGQQKTLEVVLSDPLMARSILTILNQHEEMAEVTVLDVRVRKVKKMKIRRLGKLPSLPDVEEVTLQVEGIRPGDLDNVCEVVTNLQPSTGGFSRIEFTGKMKAKDWKVLLQRLEDVTVRTVTLPLDALQGEELAFKTNFRVEHQSPD